MFIFRKKSCTSDSFQYCFPSNVFFDIFRCGLPVCNKKCEEGYLHKNYECPIFAKAFDHDTPDGDDNKDGNEDPEKAKQKMPKIENLYAACPLYTCISPLRLLLRQKKAAENSLEEVSFFFRYVTMWYFPLEQTTLSNRTTSQK